MMKWKQRMLSLMLVVLLLPVFWVAAAEARTEVEEHFPEHRAKNVPTGVVVKITFSDRMDKDSVLDGISMRDENGRDVPGKVTYDDKTYRAFFQPDRTLQYNTLYRIRLATSIVDWDGERLRATSSFSFTTIPGAVMYVDGLEMKDKPITVNHSPVRIMLDAPGATEVHYGNEELYSSGDRFYLEDAMLKPGNNSFSFRVVYTSKDDDGKTKEETVTVNKTVLFSNILDEGARVTHDFSSGSKINVFDKKVSLTFPKNYYLKEGNREAAKQILGIQSQRIYVAGGSPVVGYLIGLYPGDGAYADLTTSLQMPAGGQMTLPLDDDLAEAAFSTLTVLFDPQDGYLNNWDNLGGKVDKKKKTITVSTAGFGRYVAVNRLWTFRDEMDWPVRQQAEILWARGILNSSASASLGYFGFTDTMGRELLANRGEFVVMLSKGLGLNLPENEVSLGIFGDISFLSSYSFSYDRTGTMVPLPRNDARYIEAAAKNGIVSGVRERDGRYLFHYFDLVTREQAAVIIARAAGLPLAGTGSALQTKMASQFKDSWSISPGARPYVSAAVAGGYLAADANGNFRPSGGLTRLEAVQAVYKLMESKKLL